MEDAGIRMDRAFLEELRSELQDQCDDLERKIHAHAGEPFVVNSVPQLRRILFEKLELTPIKRTKTGPSTDADSRVAPDWVAAQLDPVSMGWKILAYGEPNPVFGGIATALVIGKILWISSFQMDRAAWLPLPGPQQ